MCRRGPGRAAEQGQRMAQHPAAGRAMAAEMAGGAEAPVADHSGAERLGPCRRLEQRRVHRHGGRSAQQGDLLDLLRRSRGACQHDQRAHRMADQGRRARCRAPRSGGRASRPWPRSRSKARRRCGHGPAGRGPARSSRDRRNGAPAAARPNGPCRRRARTAAVGLADRTAGPGRRGRRGHRRACRSIAA